MKQTTKMSRTVGQLEKMYNCLNVDFFDGELPVPIITVQSKPGTMGHCSVAKIWNRPGENTYELNIAAEVLSYPIEETIDTMVHEMVHLYCREHNIKDVSRGTQYHNGRFREEAERRGLTCVYVDKRIGWNTTPSDKLIEYALSKDWNEIKINRGSIPFMVGGSLGTAGTPGTPGAQNGGKKPSSTRKLQCPCCKNSVRATKDVRIMCMDCNTQMVRVD